MLCGVASIKMHNHIVQNYYECPRFKVQKVPIHDASVD